MVANKKIVERIHQKIIKRIAKVEDPLDFQNGCLYCFRKRMPGSLYCSKEHQHLYEFHNGKQEKTVEDEN